MSLDQQHMLIHCSSTFPSCTFNPRLNRLFLTVFNLMADWRVSGPLTTLCVGTISHECSASLIPVRVRGLLVVLLADRLAILLYLPLEYQSPHQMVCFQIIANKRTVLISLKLLHLTPQCSCCLGRGAGVFRNPDPCTSGWLSCGGADGGGAKLLVLVLSR